MKIKHIYFLFILILMGGKVLSQQLVLNEVSQGPSGNKEYVELVVVGSPTCNAIGTIDLRNYIIDDNNGTFAAGAGVGIAMGCVRFKNVAFWASIPYGTIIVIYNDNDINAAVPPNDLSMIDGNCRLIIPVSDCTILERYTSQPSTGISTYPTTGFTNCGGTWNEISMANGGDSFQLRDAAGTLLHAVSWGNNNSSNVIYFAGAATGNVMYNANLSNTNPSNQANWTNVAVAGNETPGTANNAANLAWIHSMNNSCVVLQPFGATTTSANAGCTCNGLASITPTGAISPYTYTWAPSGSNASNISGLCAGVYTVTAVSSNSCVLTATYNIASVGALSVTATTLNALCFGGATGSATVIPTGVAGPFTYTWVPAVSTTSIANGLAAGNYTVTTGAGGCTTTTIITISQPTAITTTPSFTNVSCFGGSNGSASVNVSGGTAGYTYTWSPSAGNTALATNLTMGNYTITVKDLNNCTTTALATITQPTLLNTTISAANTTCGNAVGAATLTVTGGTPNYTYSWLPSGGTASLASNLAAGTYSAIVTDNNGCTNTITATINTSGSPTVTLTGTNVACFGGSTGITSATVIGGVAPYTYSWSPIGGTAITATNLIAGNYNLVVTDANGCIDSSGIAITQPTAALTAIVSATNITCNGFNNGIANIIASGGTAGYAYNWLPSGGTGTTASALSANIYSVTITDTKNCNTTNTIAITQPNALNALITTSNISCNGLNNGVAQVIATGGNLGYTYNWLPSGGTNSVTTPNLSIGNYSVIITDANGCTKTTTTSISQPIPIANNITTNNVMCFGQTSGSVSVTASGGVGGYSYNWQPNANNTANATNLGAGIYTVVVTDANGCTKTSIITITQPQQLNIGNLNNQGICLGQTATLVANFSGGTPAYTVNWQPINSNGTSIFVSPTVSTTYSVTATDNNGCISLPALVTVSVAPSVSLAVSNSVSVCYEALTTLTTAASGGNSNYQYTWLPSNTTLSSLTFTAATNQQFTVSVSDGCSSTKKTITVLVTTKPNIKFFPPTIGCAPLCVSYYDSTLINSGVIANWNWSFTNGQVSNSSNPTICFTSAGSYSGTLNVVTTNNCSYQLSTITNISLSPKPKADFTSNLGYETTEYTSNFLFTNASTNYTSVVWYAPNSPQYSNVINVNFTDIGSYPVTLIASNNFGCQDSITKIIKINPEFTFFAPNCFTPNDNGLNDKFLPKGVGWKESTFKLAIYDRWGEQIYSTNDVLAGWDGTHRGKGGDKVQDDVYVWKVYLKDIFNKEHNYVGHVTIVK